MSVPVCTRVYVFVREGERGRKEPKDAYCDPGRCKTVVCRSLPEFDSTLGLLCPMCCVPAIEAVKHLSHMGLSLVVCPLPLLGAKKIGNLVIIFSGTVSFPF